jgi:hypothetical protein
LLLNRMCWLLNRCVVAEPDALVAELGAVLDAVWTRFAVATGSGSRSVANLAGSAPLPFVISTGAQRSGEICGFLSVERTQSKGPWLSR